MNHAIYVWCIHISHICIHFLASRTHSQEYFISCTLSIEALDIQEKSMDWKLWRQHEELLLIMGFMEVTFSLDGSAVIKNSTQMMICVSCFPVCPVGEITSWSRPLTFFYICPDTLTICGLQVTICGLPGMVFVRGLQGVISQCSFHSIISIYGLPGIITTYTHTLVIWQSHNIVCFTQNLSMFLLPSLLTKKIKRKEVLSMFSIGQRDFVSELITENTFYFFM